MTGNKDRHGQHGSRHDQLHKNKPVNPTMSDKSGGKISTDKSRQHIGETGHGRSDNMNRDD